MRILIVATRHVGDITSGADLRLFSHLRTLRRQHEFCLLHAAPRSSIPESFRIDLTEIFGDRIRVVKEEGFDWRRLVRPLGPMAISAHPLIWRRSVTRAVEAFDPDVLHADMLQACIVTPPKLRRRALAFGQDSFARFSATRSIIEPNFLKRVLFAVDARAYRFYEQVYRQFAITVFLSPNDIEAAGVHKNALLVSNGVDVLPLDSLPKERVLFFGGNLQYLPNRQGIVEFIRNVFPLIAARHPGTRMIVAGRSPDKDVQALASDSVEVVSSPSNMSDLMRRAQVVVCPVSWGSGQKNKVLEGAAAGRPVVCDPHMIEGSDFVAGKHILTAKSAEDWVARISELFTDAVRRENLRQAAYAHVREQYSWERGARVIEQAYIRLAGSGEA